MLKIFLSRNSYCFCILMLFITILSSFLEIIRFLYLLIARKNHKVKYRKNAKIYVVKERKYKENNGKGRGKGNGKGRRD